MKTIHHHLRLLNHARLHHARLHNAWSVHVWLLSSRYRLTHHVIVWLLHSLNTWRHVHLHLWLHITILGGLICSINDGCADKRLVYLILFVVCYLSYIY